MDVFERFATGSTPLDLAAAIVVVIVAAVVVGVVIAPVDTVGC